MPAADGRLGALAPVSGPRAQDGRGEASDGSVFGRWWFWTAVAAVVVAGAVAGVVASGALSRDAGCPAPLERCM
jgi:hypothetical protein